MAFLGNSASAYSPIGLDISEGVVKGAQFVRVGRGFELHAAAREEIDSASDAEAGAAKLTEALRALMAQGGFKGTKASLSMPSSEVDVREVRLAADITPADRDRFETSLRAEARACLLYDPAAAVIDYLALDLPNSPAAKERNIYLMIAVRREDAQRLLNAVKRAGLGVSALDIRPCAITRALPKGNEPVAAIEMEKQRSSVSISVGGRLQFNRIFKIGWAHVVAELAAALKVSEINARMALDRFGATEGGRWSIDFARLESAGKLESAALANSFGEMCSPALGSLGREVKRTLNYFSTQHRAVTPQKAYLVGERLFPGIEDLLWTSAALKAERAGWETVLGKASAGTTGSGAAYAVAAGLALRGNA